MAGLSIHHLVKTLKIALISILIAVCVCIQLTPRFANVEFTSFIIFIIGVLSGSYLGLFSGIVVMLVNGFLSPWGYAGINLPFQMVGMSVAGLTGGLYRKHLPAQDYGTFCFEAAVLGALIAFTYDLITNFGFAVWVTSSGIPSGISLIMVFVSGALFSLVHVVSNTIIFGTFFLPFIKVYDKYSLNGETSLG